MTDHVPALAIQHGEEDGVAEDQALPGGGDDDVILETCNLRLDPLDGRDDGFLCLLARSPGCGAEELRPTSLVILEDDVTVVSPGLGVGKV